MDVGPRERHILLQAEGAGLDVYGEDGGELAWFADVESTIMLAEEKVCWSCVSRRQMGGGKRCSDRSGLG